MHFKLKHSEGDTRRRTRTEKKYTRPVSGKSLLKLYKDRPTWASLCDALRVEYKIGRDGYPMEVTIQGIIEALIHQLVARDVSIGQLIIRLEEEMRQIQYPLTSREELEEFKSFKGEDI